jgi:hypothetical protein
MSVLATLKEREEKYVVLVKGALESLEPLLRDFDPAATTVMEKYARMGYRVIALAMK